jgi:hypothetical protein
MQELDVMEWEMNSIEEINPKHEAKNENGFSNSMADSRSIINDLVKF